MFGVGDLLFQLGWRLMPEQFRMRLSVLVQDLQLQAARPVPRSETVVYAWNNSMRKRFPGSLTPELAELTYPSYSLIATCRNEAQGIADFLAAISRLTVLPAQVVICDGGSTDGTPDVIRRWAEGEAKERGVLVELVEEGPLNISEGRNRAVGSATHEILAFTDVGATVDKLWAERLLAPFAVDPDCEVSMGWYKPVARSGLEHAFVRFMVPRLEAIDPQTFFPSGRSLAMRREVFTKTGGYPTHLTKAGEDSLFDYYMKTVAKRIAFVPEAIAFWQVPKGLISMAKTIFHYSKGDAESRQVFGSYYLTLLPQVLKLTAELAVLVLLMEAIWIWPAQLFKVMLLLVALSFSIRLLVFVRSYRPFDDCRGNWRLCLQRGFLVVLMAVSQTLGFFSGLASRRAAAERLSAQAPNGELIFFTAEVVLGGEGASNETAIRTHLDQGYYVTVVFSRYRDIMSEFDHPLAHPRLEQHLRSEFDFEHWQAMRLQRTSGATNDLRVVDECQDAFSRELSNRFTSLNA